ncbi:MAG: deoxyribonuclease IV [Clostridia bacterium]|nr:deoxyribonuclease IV [Clostridia bacterium]
MFIIGCHLSNSKGYLKTGSDALSIGANTFQFFTRNPRGGAAKPVDKADVDAYNELASLNNIGPVIAHAPYTMNPCAATESLREFSLETMRDDLYRLSMIPGSLYNFHPGSHVGQGVDAGIELIAETVSKLLETDNPTPILLETMAGKGSEVGSRFEELRRIIDLAGGDSRIGVTLDTCHVYDAGYDIVGNLDGVLDEFDKAIGLDRLRAIHLNDSKNPFCSHKDRHEKIGSGSIGLEAFGRIINHPALRELPFCLETPQEDLSGWGAEIELLKSLRNS